MRIALVFAGMLSAAMLAGLMVTLLSVFRSLWQKQSDADAAQGFRTFLEHAATNRILSTLSILPVFCAIGLAFLPTPDATKFWFAMAGGLSFLAGFFLWTAFFNLPIHRAVAAWPREVPAADARSLILRFRQANAVRLGASLLNSLLFFLAN